MRMMMIVNVVPSVRGDITGVDSLETMLEKKEAIRRELVAKGIKPLEDPTFMEMDRRVVGLLRQNTMPCSTRNTVFLATATVGRCGIIFPHTLQSTH